MGAEALGYDGPAHEFWDGEELQKLVFLWDETVPSIGINAVEKVGLFIIMGREEDVVYDSLKDLMMQMLN